MITLERIIALAMPLRTASLCTKKNSCVVLAVIILIICGIYISVYFTVYSCTNIVFNEIKTSFDDGLKKTVDWYTENLEWVNSVPTNVLESTPWKN